MSYRKKIWGKQRTEWSNIPEQLHLKDGLYVMILANDTEKDEWGKPQFRWVNGDCGHVVVCGPNTVRVKLVRTGEEHDIGPVSREFLQGDCPEYDDKELERAKQDLTPLPDGSRWDRGRRKWIRGAITYMPLRLAFATTVHKSQGLTLTGPVAFDLRESFVGESAMCYVACSRATKGENLHLVGSKELVIRRCKVDEKVRRWV
jgi:ATP-dependent exoDNAse (exonuclease V) alpha subunit